MKEIKDDTDGTNIMFVSWKNQYCENDYTTYNNLQIECNSYQSTYDIFHRCLAKKQFHKLYGNTKDTK